MTSEELREGIAQCLGDTGIGEISMSLTAERIIKYLHSQGLGTREELKIPENPYPKVMVYHRKVEELFQKFLELNKGGFKPIGYKQ